MEISSTVVDLFGNSLGKLTIGIEEAVAVSFERQKMRNMTYSSIKDRFDRCIRWATILRGDMKWGTDRIVKSLPDMLHKELDGQAWEPNSRTFWIPEDGLN